jgi:glycosyltransferase involved in cell wall biosynthesis
VRPTIGAAFWTLVRERHSYDAVLAYTGRRYSALLPLIRLFLRKALVIKTDSMTYRPGAFKTLRTRLSAFFRLWLPLRWADVVLVESPELLAATANAFGEDRVLLYPNAVPRSDFEAFERRETQIRKSDGAPIILFVGRILRRKGLVGLVGVFGSLAPRFPTWRLVIVGPSRDASHVDELCALAEQLGLAGRIEFAGECYDDDLLSWYARADIFCLPALYGEGSPNCLLQAMYFEAAVVATRMAEIPYLVGDTGVLCSPGDVFELYQALETLMEGPERRRKLGAAARARVLGHFTWEANTARIIPALRHRIRFGLQNGAGPR